MPNLYRCNYEQFEKRETKSISSKEITNEKKKINLKTYKQNTIKSLNEVECFLRNLNGFMKYVKLYKILK